MSEPSLSPIDVLDVLAVILGIVYSLRRQWVARRRQDDFPGVDSGLFRRWQERARRAYTLLTNACFGKLLLDVGWFYGAVSAGASLELLRSVSMAIDLGWLGLLFWGLRLRAQAQHLRREMPALREAPAGE